ncbi:MAG: hypothetical protein COZ80_04915 [Ignavibacteria bacterium CG_4_8_14_3_um_filter_37_9]|nr:MAG: hypothetical protein AUJ54_07230 [Ignavibacteria bacterium CG1_02_37_35]PIW99521.1 MAG: hypothetical protein COZ80_04915 [Ignavibacteria bacterium CG_4_8_14_3_um_filter_37_9]
MVLNILQLVKKTFLFEIIKKTGQTCNRNANLSTSLTVNLKWTNSEIPSNLFGENKSIIIL